MIGRKKAPGPRIRSKRLGIRVRRRGSLLALLGCGNLTFDGELYLSPDTVSEDPMIAAGSLILRGRCFISINEFLVTTGDV